jgi:hypothetical protein
LEIENEPIYVFWRISNFCNGHFNDIFTPVPNIILTNVLPCHTISSKYNIITYYTTHDVDSYASDTSLYNMLEPTDVIQQRINHIKNVLGNNYVAIHVRRTDHTELAKNNNNFTQDQAFVDFLKNYKNKNIYIATDNINSQKFFYNIFKKQIKFVKWINNKNLKYNKRKTTLEDAVVDMFVCAGASHFMGSGYSSMTEIINKLRTN